LAYTTPLILIFWAGTRFQRMGTVYGGLALVGSLFIIWHGTGIVRNNVAGASDSAPEAARFLAGTQSNIVQTMSYDADYACLRFYLRHAGWNGSVEVSRTFDAPWVFESAFAEGVIPKGYQPTSVSGLYGVAPKVEPEPKR
jgi:hypothetical protein